jgi:hypothetical protein
MRQDAPPPKVEGKDPLKEIMKASLDAVPLDDHRTENQEPALVVLGVGRCCHDE